MLVSLKSISKFFFFSVCLMTGVLSAEEKQFQFDEEYTVNIMYCHAKVSQPNLQCDDWTTHSWIHFDNGLCASMRKTEWKHECQAKEKADLEEYTNSGEVNIIYDRNSHKSKDYSPTYWWREDWTYFKLIFKERNWGPVIDSLWVKQDYSFEYLPVILSVTENVETISHWFSTEYKYRYVIELNDGTTWLTKTNSSSWQDPWEVGAKILKIGNCYSPCFINIDKVTQTNYINKVDGKNYLVGLELMN
jgi:hypothetical protein